MTRWAYLRFTEWRLGSPDHAAVTVKVCQFLGAEELVQVVGPATGSFEAGQAMLEWIRDRVALTSDDQPVRIFVHPDRGQLDSIVASGLPAGERVVIVLWSPEPGFEGWVYSRGGVNLATGTTVNGDPVVMEALRSVPLNNGLAGGYGRDRLVEALVALHGAGYALTGPELEVAGATVGMDLDDLRHVRDHAERTAKGKAMRITTPRLRSDVVAIWEAAAQGRASDL